MNNIDNIANFLQELGYDLEDESLKDTPTRFIKMMFEMHKKEPFSFTTFDAKGADQMIVVDNIPFYSLCEHHMVPFFGVAHVAYIPNKRIVGLSKIPRTVARFSRGLQTQEYITQNIAKYLYSGFPDYDHELLPKGVAVVLYARHLCMEMRGAKSSGAQTRTSALHGCFDKQPEVRSEFFDLIANKV